MYHRINESVNSAPNRPESRFVELESLATVDNVGNSIRKLDMSIGSFAFDLRHRKGSKEGTKE